MLSLIKPVEIIVMGSRKYIPRKGGKREEGRMIDMLSNGEFLLISCGYGTFLT